MVTVTRSSTVELRDGHWQAGWSPRRGAARAWRRWLAAHPAFLTDAVATVAALAAAAVALRWG